MRVPDPSLAGKRVWVTRPARQAAGLCGLIAARQGVAVKMPTLAILPAREGLSLSARARRVRESDIVVFISRNAVVHAHDLFPQLGAMLRGKTVCAVGRATAATLANLGVDGALRAGAGGAEALLQLPALSGARVPGKRVLIARGRGGRERLRDGLAARGAEVAYLEVYRREKPAVSRAVMEQAWRDETPDAVVVTSLAGLNNLIEMTPASEQARLRETALVVMSERIERQAMEQGFFRVGAAADNSDAGLVSALVKMNEAGQLTKCGDEHEKEAS